MISPSELRKIEKETTEREREEERQRNLEYEIRQKEHLKEALEEAKNSLNGKFGAKLKLLAAKKEHSIVITNYYRSGFNFDTFSIQLDKNYKGDIDYKATQVLLRLLRKNGFGYNCKTEEITETDYDYDAEGNSIDTGRRYKKIYSFIEISW